MKDEGSIQEKFLPTIIFFDPRLNWNERIVWWRINSLDLSESHCYATNERFAKELNLGLETIKRAIKKLEKCEYIEVFFKKTNKTKSGWKRIIKVNRSKISSKKIGAQNEPLEKTYTKEVFHTSSSYLLRKIRRGSAGFPASPSLKKETRYIVDTWNQLGWPFTKHNKNTATYARIEKAIEKTLKDHSAKLIIKSIVDFGNFIKFDQTRLNVKAIRATLKLHEFLGFSLFLKKRLEASNNKLLRHANSWFEDAVKGRKHLLEKYGRFVENKYPAVAKKIQEGWEKLFPDFEAKASDLNNFRKAAEKLIDFIAMNKKRLRVSNRELYFPAQFVPYLLEYIKKGGMLSNNRKVHTGYLIQDFMYEDGFREWLIKNNYLTSRRG